MVSPMGAPAEHGGLDHEEPRVSREARVDAAHEPRAVEQDLLLRAASRAPRPGPRSRETRIVVGSACARYTLSAAWVVSVAAAPGASVTSSARSCARPRARRRC